MKRLLILILMLLVVPVVFSDSYDIGSTFTPTKNLVTYYVPQTNMTGVTNLSIGTLCVNITGGTFDYDHCSVYSTLTNETLCDSNDDCVNGFGVYANSGYCSASKLCRSAPAVVGGGGSGSSTAQTSGTCPFGSVSWNYHCIQGTYLTSFALNEFNTAVCPDRKVYWSIQMLNNEGGYELPESIDIMFKYNNSITVIKPLKLMFNSYVFNDYIDFKGQDKIEIELLAKDTIIGIWYNVTYTTTITKSDCTGLDLTLLNTLKKNSLEIIDSIKETWQNGIYDGSDINKKNVMVMIVLILCLISGVYYLLKE